MLPVLLFRARTKEICSYCCFQINTGEAGTVPAFLSSHLCVYFLTWLDSDVCGFTEQEAEFMRSLAGSGHFAELLRLHFFVWMMLTTNPAKFEDLANVCFEVIVHEDVAEKARDYLKYVIEHIEGRYLPKKRMIIRKSKR